MSTDPSFVESRIERGKQALQKAVDGFAGISHEQFNWKPNKDAWSMAECLEHLVISDSSYFKVLREIASGRYQMSFWVKYSPFSKMLGRMLVNGLREEPARKMKTNKKLEPRLSAHPLSYLDLYVSNIKEFMDLVSKCQSAELDKTLIQSPMLSWVTYPLRDALEFLFEHEHRHLNQALRLKTMKGFPQ